MGIRALACGRVRRAALFVQVTGFRRCPTSQWNGSHRSCGAENADDGHAPGPSTAGAEPPGLPRIRPSQTRAAPPSARESILALLAAATALPARSDTDGGMSNAAPPPSRRPDGRRSGAPAAPPPVVTPTPHRQSPTPSPAGVPSSWGGAAALLARTTAVRPGGAAPINAALLRATGPSSVQVDLSGMWAAPADPTAPANPLELRRLDDKHRLMLPITTSGPVRLAAQRDHAVLTVFLPDAPGAPAPGRSVAPLALAARGRLTLGQNVCAELGLSSGSSVVVVLDPDRRTLSICAASRMQDAVLAGLDAARQAPAKPSRQGAPGAPASAPAVVQDATILPLRRAR